MKAKILAGVALMTLATAATLTYAGSTTTGSTSALKGAFSKMHLTGSGGFNNERHEKARGMGSEGFEMKGMG